MSTASTGKALVLGQDTRSFLTVIRSLGRAGIEVHIGWCPSKAPSTHSRYVRKIHHIPRPWDYTSDWKNYFIQLLRREKFDLVIPCDDPSIIPLQKNRNLFEDLVRIALLNDYAFGITSDKDKSYRLAKSLRIPVPNQIRIANITQIDNILSEFRAPFVLKPISSFTNHDLYNRKDVQKIFNPSDLVAALSMMLHDGDVLVQENFGGIGTGVELLVEDGEILVAFQHVRVHEPPYGGGSSYRVSVALNDDLLAAATKIVKSLNYTGVAMVEFKMDNRSGHWAFLEVNGRFWGSLPLAVSAGVNFPLYLYQLLVEGKRKFHQVGYEIGVYCRNLTLDIDCLRANLAAYKSAPNTSNYKLSSELVQLVKNLLSGKEKNDTFVIDDLLPALLDVLFWCNAKLSGLKRRIVRSNYT